MAGYARVLDERLFAPLGMTRSTLDFAAVLADPVTARPHAPHRAHWSTGAHMARYLQALLTTGGGTGIVSPEGFAHLTAPQVPVSATMSYGLGWFVEAWRGQRLVHHGGNTFGFTSEVAFLPEAGAGIVILTNAGRANDFVQAVRARFLEVLFDLPETHHAGAQIARAEADRRKPSSPFSTFRSSQPKNAKAQADMHMPGSSEGFQSPWGPVAA